MISLYIVYCACLMKLLLIAKEQMQSIGKNRNCRAKNSGGLIVLFTATIYFLLLEL